MLFLTYSTASSSHPVRGAWIEIISLLLVLKLSKSHPVRGAWIEITRHLSSVWRVMSHPVRGAWIEISRIGSLYSSHSVASRKGCVD